MTDLLAGGLLDDGWSWLGAGLGAMLAVGGLLFVARLPVNRRPGLEARLTPYLRDTARPSRLLAAPRDKGGPALLMVLRPVLRDLGRGVERLLGGATSVRRRMERAGQSPDVESFRAEQVVWGVCTGAIGPAMAIVMWLKDGGSVIPLVLLVLCAAGIGIVARDQLLTRSANRREQQMLAEFPTVAELLALAVGAGEGATGALERVCRLSEGQLASELRQCLADAHAGANLAAALQGLADRTGLASLARFVDGIVIAVERGTPLADLLRSQAQDVREAGRRAVMEEGGKKEIAMMIPTKFDRGYTWTRPYSRRELCRTTSTWSPWARQPIHDRRRVSAPVGSRPRDAAPSWPAVTRVSSWVVSAAGEISGWMSCRQPRSPHISQRSRRLEYRVVEENGERVGIVSAVPPRHRRHHPPARRDAAETRRTPSHVPCELDEGDFARLLGGCDRNVGLRNCAILTVLWRLGLRRGKLAIIRGY
jgi:tight adherence protein C